MILKRQKAILKANRLSQISLPLWVLILQIVIWVIIGISILTVHAKGINKLEITDTEELTTSLDYECIMVRGRANEDFK